MDLVDSILSHGDRVLQAHDQYRFTILTGDLAGEKFSAHGQQAGESNVPLELADDPREKSTIYVIPPALAIKRGDRVEGKGARWIVVHRSNNPMTTTVDFILAKLADGDV